MQQRKLKATEFSSREAPRFEVFGSGARVELRRRKRFMALWALLTMLSCLALLFAIAQQENRESTVAQQTSPQMVKVLMPIVSIPKGTKLSQSLFVVHDADSSVTTEKAFHSLGELDDLYARMNLVPTAALTKDLVTSLPPAEMIESLIPPGSRAISLAVDATSGVEGWAKPGVHVDVLVSYLDQVDANRKTQIVVLNAVVLSFNGWTEKMLAAAEAQADENPPVQQVPVPQSATVTLGVQSDEALIIRNAQMLGTISLILRTANDVKGGAVLSVSEDEFRIEPSSPPTVPTPGPVAPPIVTRLRPEASVSYLDRKTGAEVRKDMVRGEWRLGE